MKTTTLKKLFAFITIVVFSHSFTYGQNCNGNKVYVCKQCPVYGGFNTVCECVNPSQVNTWYAAPCNGNGNNGNHGNGNNGNSGWDACICARISDAVTSETSLQGIYPNPVAGSSNIYFTMGETQKVSLKIYDVNGRLILTLANGVIEAGTYQSTWNADDAASGMYFLKMEAGEFSQAEKISVIK